MKKVLLLLPSLLFIISYCFTTQAQVQEWQSIQNFPDSRSGAVRFVIGDTAYVGTGYTGSAYKKSFYKYNPEDGNWRVMNDYPGAARENAVAFVADGKAYVGTGTDGTTQLKDFYEYDPSTDTWTAIADLPGEIRNQASSFSINDKGYVGLGGNNTGSLNDFYEFDPSTGSWNPITGLPTDDARSKAVGFSANGKGYIAGGYDGSFTYSGLLSYDPTSDSWTEEIFADVKLSSLQQNTDFIDGEGLVHILKAGFTNEQVIIDLSDNSLKYGDFYFDDERNRGVAFYLDGEAYAGTGLVYDQFGNGFEQSDFRKLVTIEPPEAPENFRVFGSDPTRFSWSSVDNALGYIVYISEETDKDYKVVDTLTNSWIDLDNLKRGVKYYGKLAAYNQAGASPSQELSFYPAFDDGKLNSPELLKIIEDPSDSSAINFIYDFVIHDFNVEAVFEMSYDGIEYDSVLSKFFPNSYRDTVTMVSSKNSIKFEKQSENLYFRIKLVKEGREDSDYSNVYSIHTQKLQPKAPNLSFNYSERESSFSYNIITHSANNVEEKLLYSAMNDSIIDMQEDFGYFSFYLKPKDSIQIYAVSKNFFGADTSKLSIIGPPLTPFFGNELKTSIDVIQFSIAQKSDQYYGQTVIERSEDGINFSVIDTINYTSYGSYFDQTYYDQNIKSNTNYFYRLKNIEDNLISSYSGIRKIKSEKMSSWKVFRRNTLDIAKDTANNVTNINFFDKKVFFLSALSKHAFYFDLDKDISVSMPSIPVPGDLRSFSAVEFLNGKLYCFTPRYHSGFEEAIYIYDLEEKKWSVKEISDIGVISYVNKISETEFIFAAYNSLGIYNTITGVLKLSNLNTPGEPTYSKFDNDSILIFDEAKNIYIADKALSTLRRKDNKTDQVLRKELIISHKNELIQVSNRGLYELDFSSNKYLNYRESYGSKGISNGIVFDYQDTLVCLPTFARNLVYSFRYKDDNSPGPLTGVRIGNRKHNEITLQWFDSPEETSYAIELKKGDFFNTENIMFDTIPENSIEYTFCELAPSSRYNLLVTPLKDKVSGQESRIVTRTKSAYPSLPEITNFQQKSQDSINLTWAFKEYSFLNDSLEVLFYGIDAGFEKFEIKSTDSSQTISLVPRKENIKQFVKITCFNTWSANYYYNISDTILTRLNSPHINQVAYFEKEGKYQVVINDNSEFETQFKLFRKSKEQEDFKLLETIEGNQPNEFSIDDFIDDPSVSYEYYIQSYLIENDSSINSSFPSNIASTENAVLSNTPLQSDELSIFPNPVSEHIFISSDLNVQLQKLEVLSVDGRLIKSYEDTEIIDVSGLEKGIYLLKIKAKSGEIVKRFIKE